MVVYFKVNFMDLQKTHWIICTEKCAGMDTWTLVLSKARKWHHCDKSSSISQLSQQNKVFVYVLCLFCVSAESIYKNMRH